MELIESLLPVVVRPVNNPVETERTDSNRSSFIEANTIPMSFEEIKNDLIIPVFVSSNETLISHSDFVEAMYSIAAEVFEGEQILYPQIRVSHPIKGRIPEAKDKPANQLMDFEKTLIYERMAFIIEVPSIQTEIDGNLLSLTIGGVKSYASDNLYSRSKSDQTFKIFIGFKNTVCTNLCVFSDGYVNDVKVKSLGMLKGAIRTLLEGYERNFHVSNMKKLTEFSITEQQFANLLGRCRMYNHLPAEIKSTIPALLFGENQMSSVVKDFYRDSSFCRDTNGGINLWRLYNLFTGSNKTSYIDTFLDRSVNAFSFVEQIRWALEDQRENWYLN